MGRDRQRASWSTWQCADDPGLRHAVHLPLTVGHPLWVTSVGLALSGKLPVYSHQPTCSCIASTEAIGHKRKQSSKVSRLNDFF